jgi:hypothetical protein
MEGMSAWGKYLTNATRRWSGKEFGVVYVFACEFADDVDLGVALQAAARNQDCHSAALIREEPFGVSMTRERPLHGSSVVPVARDNSIPSLVNR